MNSKLFVFAKKYISPVGRDKTQPIHVPVKGTDFMLCSN